jgi:hypothetical protein
MFPFGHGLSYTTLEYDKYTCTRINGLPARAIIGSTSDHAPVIYARARGERTPDVSVITYVIAPRGLKVLMQTLN